MKNSSEVFAMFIFLFSTYCNINAQILDHVNLHEGVVDFTLSNLYQLTDNQRIIGPPFYEAFVMYGDGNFERISLRKKKVTANHTFKYTYRDIDCSFPGVVCLIARKDNRPPPPKSMILTPNVGADTYVNISASANINTNRLVESNIVNNELPIAPMIPTGSIDRVAMGFSHYFSGNGGFYFLEKESIHAIPIAYKLKKNGVVLFFYSNGIEKIDYYDQVPMTNNSSGITFMGSTVSNYYQPSIDTPAPTIREVIKKMKTIKILFNQQQPQTYLEQIGIDVSGSEYFDKGVAHIITQTETDLLGTDVSGPPTSPGQKELRLFHFLETPDQLTMDDTIHKEASFLAVLYENRDTHNSTNLNMLNNILVTLSNGLTFPPNLIDTSLKFVDYDIIYAVKGEPDDPGGLVVESICKCCDDYVVNFGLTFCNAVNATESAKGADVFLESLLDGQFLPLFSNFTLLSSCVEGVDSCNVLTCNTQSDTIDTHKAFCFDFSNLMPGNCGTIRFSARMKGAEVDRLIDEPVMKYCVKFRGQIDSPEFCLYNDIIRDELCSTEGFLNCTPNPVWSKRNEQCQEPLLSQNNCQPWNCSITTPAVPNKD